MNVTEVLQLVDDLIFQHTGTHLNDLQRNTVSGLWQGQSYSEMAEEFNYKSENHVGNISRELYKKLSEALGEDINKQNFCWTIERIYNSPFANSLVYKNINFCPNHSPNSSRKSHDQQPNEQIPYQNLRQSPKVIKFYGREQELLQLAQWVANIDTRLISVLGLAGIGKSILVKHFIDINTETFHAIIWKNIDLYQSLDDILQEIVSEISPPNTQTNIQKKTCSNLLDQCLEIFTEKRCLIILDNLEKIFASQELAGSYQTQHIDYKKFLQKITTTEHQSCLIVISQEKSQEMISLDPELYPSQCLELSGLGESATNILQNFGLQDKEYWQELVNLYESHPQYLQYIAILIQEIFGRKVSDFIRENSLLITENLKYLFDEIWHKLSEPEKLILKYISQSKSPVNRENIKNNLSLSSSELINGLQSLNHRFVLTLSVDTSQLIISPIFQEYIKLYQSKS